MSVFLAPSQNAQTAIKRIIKEQREARKSGGELKVAAITRGEFRDLWKQREVSAAHLEMRKHIDCPVERLDGAMFTPIDLVDDCALNPEGATLLGLPVRIID